MAEGLKLAVTLVYGRICDIYFYFLAVPTFLKTAVNTCYVELALIHLECDYPHNTSSTIHCRWRWS